MRWLTIQSSLPQMAMAPRWPYLPMPSVTRAMTTMMSTTRPPLRLLAPLELDELVRDQHQAQGDGREDRVQQRQRGHRDPSAKSRRRTVVAQRQPEDEQRDDDDRDQVVGEVDPHVRHRPWPSGPISATSAFANCRCQSTRPAPPGARGRGSRRLARRRRCSSPRRARRTWPPARRGHAVQHDGLLEAPDDVEVERQLDEHGMHAALAAAHEDLPLEHGEVVLQVAAEHRVATGSQIAGPSPASACRCGCRPRVYWCRRVGARGQAAAEGPLAVLLREAREVREDARQDGERRVLVVPVGARPRTTAGRRS